MQHLTGETLPEAVTRFGAALDRHLHATADEFLESVDHPFPVDASGPFRVAIEGGKRFRGLCAAIGATAAQSLATGYTGSDHSQHAAANLLDAASRDERVLALGCALEFYQASALVHDDLLDNSPTRRGLPATHAHFSREHVRQGLLGDPVQFGRDGAVLVGNLLTSAAEFALSHALHEAGANDALVRAYSVMTGEVAVGQLADTSAAYLPLAEGDAGVNDALEVVRRRSARYSVVHPAVLGAILAGGGQDVRGWLRDILEPAGIAFQLRDDELGAFGQDDATGKPTGIDIVEGKRTVLLALALRGAPPPEQARLAQIVQAEVRSPQAIQEAVDLLDQYGRADHEEMIVRFRRQALEALESSNFQGAARDLLGDLVRRVVDRSA